MVMAIGEVPACPELDAAVVGLVLGREVNQINDIWVMTRDAPGQTDRMPNPSRPRTAEDMAFLLGCLVWLTQQPGGYVVREAQSVAEVALQVCRDVCVAGGLAGLTIGVRAPHCVRCGQRHVSAGLYCQPREGLRRPQ